MRTVLFWFVTRRLVAISYRHFETTYHPIFRGLGSIGNSETSVRNYHYSLHNNPEERSSHVLRGGNLKSRKILDDFKETRGCCKPKQDALGCTL